MSGRRWVVAALLLSAIGWWYSPLSPRPAQAPPPAVAGFSVDCPMPPLVERGGEPRQSPVPGSLQPFALQAATLTPLAGFSIDARVLSREDYRTGREAELSPTDLALAWGRMREDTVLARLDISQGGRFFSYRWRGEPPLPPAELARSAANMHLIPATPAVAEALQGIDADDHVRIQGWLVEANASDGWRWRSSTTRTDAGAGACELVYVCAIERL